MDFYYTTFAKLAGKIPVTLLLLALSLLLGVVLGFLLAIAQVYRVRFFGRFAKLYSTFVRSVPTVILIYIAYFILPALLGSLGIATYSVNKLYYAVAGLGISYSAFFAEVFRSGMNNVEPGQVEAALSLGMDGRQLFSRVLLPQMLISCIPNFSSLFLALLKETSTAFLIGVVDIMGQAKITAAYSHRLFDTYLVAGVLYWLLCLAFEQLFRLLEKKANKEGAQNDPYAAR